MDVTPLPANPDLERLRERARALQAGVRSGDADALAVVREHHPRLAGLTAGDERAMTFKLADAQLALARCHGLPSWPALRRHVEVVRELARAPHRVDVPAELATAEQRTDAVVRLGCLTYGEDDPASPAAAQRLLDAHPDLVRSSLAAACAAGDVAAVRRHLAADAEAVRRPCGPFRWEPLLYVTYSRLPAGGGHDHIATARLLLQSGADPNAGYLWEGHLPPFTALTGALGGGEGDQSLPPQWRELAEVLLRAGADPDDIQGLYNRTFRDDDSHLELLFAHGLGRGDGGPWRRRFGDALDTAAQFLKGQLHWAITHGRVGRVRILAANGVDVSTPFTDVRQHYWRDDRTPVQLAQLHGQDEIVQVLVEHGAPATSPDPVDAVIAALLSGDGGRVESLEQRHAGLVARARAARPGLAVWAAALGRHEAVRLLLDHGFDVNVLARGDVPLDEPRETALHQAAHRGDRPMAELLLTAGADPTVRDARFDATPLGWAEHAGAQELVDLLEPLTPPA